MKVKVTKDSFGVTVWEPDADIVFVPGKNMGKDEVYWVGAWQKRKFSFATKILIERKQVKKYMPELGSDLNVGQMFEGELTIGE